MHITYNMHNTYYIICIIYSKCILYTHTHIGTHTHIFLYNVRKEKISFCLVFLTAFFSTIQPVFSPKLLNVLCLVSFLKAIPHNAARVTF